MSTSEQTAHEALAGRLFSAIAVGDIDTIRACYAEDALLRNHAGAPDMGPDDVVGLVQLVSEKLPDLVYDQIRRQPTPTGFVQQHVLVGTGTGGEEFAIPVCCVGTVENGRITRMEEYADSAAFGALGL